MYSANIKKLGVIHRGFSSNSRSTYRNNPEWQIAIELQNKFPDLPLICDPSHICGRRDIIHDVSQKALDLNFDGLMIESHIDPDNAWSDAAQQITPSNLIKLMKELKIRNVSVNQEDYLNNLERLRTKIDAADNEILDILGNRMKFSDEIGKLKKKENVAILQSKRWNEILGKMILEGKDRGLSEEFVLKIFKAIHQESINHQEKILNS